MPSKPFHELRQGESARVKISVIIPTLNEEAMIARCLESLVQTGFPKDEFEVIVVDNGSTDRTVEVAREFTPSLSLEVFSQRNAHISALRNLGASASRGEILAFLDADCLASPVWLSAALYLLSDPKAGVEGAHYQIPADATWVGRFWYQDRVADRIGNVSYVPAGDLLIRRDAFLRVGGFDESIQTNEDFELCQRILAAGLPVRSHPDLRVVHLGTPRTLRSFYRKQRWHGTHVVTVFLRDPQKKKNRRPILFSLYTLVCLAALIGATLAGIAGTTWKMAEVSMAALMAPVFSLALVRSGRRGKWLQVFPLTLLYLTFGVARAACLLDYKTWASPARHVSTNGAPPDLSPSGSLAKQQQDTSDICGAKKD
jgi:cellulose synthase/poly-beta-1,6-N-acetylglucosamine synthase-like glycosyltransferase